MGASVSGRWVRVVPLVGERWKQGREGEAHSGTVSSGWLKQWVVERVIRPGRRAEARRRAVTLSWRRWGATGGCEQGRGQVTSGCRSAGVVMVQGRG